MILKFKKLHPNAVLPTFSHDDEASQGTAIDRGPVDHKSRIYDTGLAVDIPNGYYVELYIRSGLAFKHNMILANGVGIVDAGFIGQIKCKLTYLGEGLPYWPRAGDRIAQGRLVKLTKTQIEWVENIDSTERGDGGFGSTGE